MSTTPDSVPPPTVGALMRLAWLAFRDQIYGRVAESGFTDLQPAHVLLFRYPTIANMRPGELADQVGVSKQAMNDVLRHLQRSGYIELRPDPSDGRARLITLTDRGSTVMELVRTAAASVAGDWADAVGRERFDSFHATLVDLVKLGDSRARLNRPS